MFFEISGGPLLRQVTGGGSTGPSGAGWTSRPHLALMLFLFFLSGCEEAYSDKPCLFFMWAVLIASLAARVSRCFDRSGEQRGRISEREARTPSVNSSGRQSCSNKDELTTRMLRRKSLNPIYLNDWLIRKLPVKMLVFKLLPSADIALDKQSIQIGVLV